MKKISTFSLLLFGALFLSQINVIHASDNENSQSKHTKNLHKHKYLLLTILQYLDLPSVSLVLQKVLLRYPVLARELLITFQFPQTFPIQKENNSFPVSFDRMILLLDTIFNHSNGDTETAHQFESCFQLKKIFEPALRFDPDVAIPFLQYNGAYTGRDFYYALTNVHDTSIDNEFSLKSVNYNYLNKKITFWQGSIMHDVTLPLYVIFEFVDMQPQMRTIGDLQMVYCKLAGYRGIEISFLFYIHHRQMLLTFFYPLNRSKSLLPYGITIDEACNCSYSYERWENAYGFGEIFSGREPHFMPSRFYKYEVSGLCSEYILDYHFKDVKISSTDELNQEWSNPWFYYLKSISVKYFEVSD